MRLAIQSERSESRRNVIFKETPRTKKSSEVSMKKYNRLSAGERLTIHSMRKAGEKISKIAKAVGRATGTISKELNRHRHDHGQTWLRMSGAERARFAENRARRNASRRGRKAKLSDETLREFVLKKLSVDHWSPEAIAARSKIEGLSATVCARTIYSWIKLEQPECREFLRRRGSPRRQRVCHRRGKFRSAAPAKRCASERSIEALERKELGHFEADLVVSCKGGQCAVLALRERVLRQRQYVLIPDLKAATVLAALRALLVAWPPEFVKSVTFDNGSEFCTTEMSKLETYFPGLKIYYTHPYSAWEKGAVENANGELRWYYPKGTDFSKVEPQDLRDNVARLNRKPMKCHGWKSAQEMLDSIAA